MKIDYKSNGPDLWETWTPQQRRIQLAKDILRYEIVAGTGHIVNSEDASPPDFTDSREWAAGALAECPVCAKGALLLTKVAGYNHFDLEGSAVVRNKYTTQDIEVEQREVTVALSDAFSQEQLDMIEVAFEGDGFPWTKLSEKQVEDCLTWHSDEHGTYGITELEMLHAIARNILANSGTFTPRKENDETT